MCRRIIAQPLLQLGQRRGADEVEPKRAEAEVHDMAMRVDQPGQHRLPVRVDHRRGLGPRIAGMQHAHDLAAIVDQHAGEMLHLSVGIDLDAVGMVDQRVGRAGEDSSAATSASERISTSARLSIVWSRVKR